MKEGDNGEYFVNMIQDNIEMMPKWRNHDKQSTLDTMIASSSSQANTNNQRKVVFTEDIDERESSNDVAEEKSPLLCQTPSVSSPVQHCSKTTHITEEYKPRICAKGDAICIPANYSKFDLPNELERTEVSTI